MEVDNVVRSTRGGEVGDHVVAECRTEEKVSAPAPPIMKSLPDVLVGPNSDAAGPDQRRILAGLALPALSVSTAVRERGRHAARNDMLQLPALPTVVVPRLVVPLNTVTVAPASPLPISEWQLPPVKVGAVGLQCRW